MQGGNAGCPLCPWCGTRQQPAERRRARRTPGTGSIYKASGRRKKPWTAEAIREGVRVNLGYFSEKREAEDALAKFRESSTSVTGWGMTVKEAFDAWSMSHFQSLTSAGIGGYKDAWKRFGAACGGMKMRKLKTVHIQQVLDSAAVTNPKTGESRPLSKSGKEKIKQLASQLCQWAMQQDIIAKNYAEFVRITAPPEKEREISTDLDIARLKTNDQDDTTRMILTLIYSGMRINEFLGMRIENVHLESGYIIGGEKTEAERNREIPIHRQVRPYIAEWIRRANDGQELLLVNSAGGMIRDDNWRDRKYYPKLDELGISRKSPHSTRRTFATLSRRAGMREEVLQRILGHAKFSTTDLYIKKETADLLDAINLF